jgi:hypothetical protein
MGATGHTKLALRIALSKMGSQVQFNVGTGLQTLLEQRHHAGNSSQFGNWRIPLI